MAQAGQGTHQAQQVNSPLQLWVRRMFLAAKTLGLADLVTRHKEKERAVRSSMCPEVKVPVPSQPLFQLDVAVSIPSVLLLWGAEGWCHASEIAGSATEIARPKQLYLLVRILAP